MYQDEITGIVHPAAAVATKVVDMCRKKGATPSFAARGDAKALNYIRSVAALPRAPDAFLEAVRVLVRDAPAS